MHSFTTLATLGLAAASLVSAAPSKKQPKTKQFPISNNFPFSNPAQIANIEKEAFGQLPGTAAPPLLNQDTFTTLRFLNVAEMLEAKFFDELIFNITQNKEGYKNIPERDYTIATFKSMRAVEMLHTLNVENALKGFGKDIIQPCEFKFPVNNFPDAVGLIGNVTSFVEAILQNIIKRAAVRGDGAFTQGVVAAAENEAEQEGEFRHILGLRPNEKPFHTIGARNMAFSLQQDLIVPGSCPNYEIPNFETDIGKLIQPLTVESGNPPTRDTEIEFSIDFQVTRVLPFSGSKVQNYAESKTNAQELARKYGHDNSEPMFITWLNGQNHPVSCPIKDRKLKGTKLFFKADFPFSQFQMFGLSIASLTTTDLTNDKTADEDVVFNDSLYGPALIFAQENFPSDEISKDNGRPANVDR